MVIVDEIYHSTVFQLSRVDMIKILTTIKEIKEQEIEMIKEKINKYEQKKRAEETWYQSLSPFRKIFTGRPLNHHQAVEYRVYVKNRFKKIEQIKQQLNEINQILMLLKEKEETDQLALSSVMINEIKKMEGEQL
ncbi:hypothetical protein FZC66_09640 [Priestia megaterium]|nr:hypothetical protein FZC66_09640 [Priestia megaterium]